MFTNRGEQSVGEAANELYHRPRGGDLVRSNRYYAQLLWSDALGQIANEPMCFFSGLLNILQQHWFGVCRSYTYVGTVVPLPVCLPKYRILIYAFYLTPIMGENISSPKGKCFQCS